MSDLIAILQALKGWTPLATVFAVILSAHYFHVWLWWKDHAAIVNKLTRDVENANEEKDRMIRVAFRAVGLGEDAFAVVKRNIQTDVS